MSYFSLDIVEEGEYVKITGFTISTFYRDMHRKWRTTRLMSLFESTFMLFGKGTLKMHKFFLPELLYIIEQLPDRFAYSKLSELILTNTWMASTQKSFQSRINPTRLEEFKITLNPYQKDFIYFYEHTKHKQRLNGMILAFEQGLGKTFTSLALMHSLDKNAVIIVAPKSTIRNVWETHIKRIFKEPKKIWIVGEPPTKANFYIVNYESIEKLNLIQPFIEPSDNVGIIVDECHNFRNTDAKRVINLLQLAKRTECEDTLLMSGTPIKALGSEMIPALKLIDPFFTDEAAVIFKRVFGVNVPVALDIIKNRLGLIIHRKLKSEVLDLPSKTEKEIKITIPNGDEFTLEHVKTLVFAFVMEREKHYKENYHIYEKEYNDCIDYIETTFRNEILDNPDYDKYMEIVEYLKKHGYTSQNAQIVEMARWANRFEKEFIIPKLTSELKKKFIRSKAVIKYVSLKIMGEVIGGLLNRLRAKMFTAMINHSPLCSIISDAEKKTVCFTTFVDVALEADKYVKSKCKSNPLLVYGETSSNIIPILKEFKSNPKKNPLIATIQTLSTGVTLTEANTVVFVNKPWRYVDYTQASDRVHRIGQDSDVVIYTFILDTNGKPNLSTRMEDIVSWSKEMFTGIVGEEEV